jgi:hypothetical protein
VSEPPIEPPPVVEDPEGPPLEAFVPRRSVETDPMSRIMQRFERLEQQVARLQKGGGSLRSASLSDDATLTVLNDDGTEAARLGLLSDGSHGIEVFSGGVWKKVT